VIKGQLELLSRYVDPLVEFFMHEVTPFLEELRDLEQSVPSHEEPVPGSDVHQRVQKALDQSYAACRRLEECYDAERTWIEAAQRAFRRLTQPWLQHSWYAHRARSKPSGFAGDYQMLLTLYHGRTPARGLGGYIDLCLGELPLARAVVTRLAALRQFLHEAVSTAHQPLTILNIACGPCFEFSGWSAELACQDCQVIALDNDPAALKYVETEVVPHLPARICVRPVHYNAFRTRSVEGNRRRFGTPDIIYSVGLCDYLPDKVLIELLRAWYETLADGGTLYVAFKDSTRYDKTPYQWHLDWFFYQRTFQDVVQLYEAAGLPVADLVMQRDASGIIMNFVLSKPRHTLVRLDARDRATPANVPHTAATGDVSAPRAGELQNPRKGNEAP